MGFLKRFMSEWKRPSASKCGHTMMDQVHHKQVGACTVCLAEETERLRAALVKVCAESNSEHGSLPHIYKIAREAVTND